MDAVDGAAASMAGMTSQPALSSIVSAIDHTERATGGVAGVRCWSSSRTGRRCARRYAPFETGLRAPTGRVYRHEIPGGQLSNLRQQAVGARARRPLRGGRARLREGQRAARPHRQGDADEQGRRRPRAVRRVGRHRLGRAAANPGALRPPRLGAPAPARRPGGARRRACRSRSPSARCAAAERATDNGHGAHPRAARAARPAGHRPPRGARRAAVPRPGAGARRGVRALQRRVAIPTRASSTACRTRRELSIELEPGVRLILELEAVGEPDERGMRTCSRA